MIDFWAFANPLDCRELPIPSPTGSSGTLVGRDLRRDRRRFVERLAQRWWFSPKDEGSRIFRAEGSGFWESGWGLPCR